MKILKVLLLVMLALLGVAAGLAKIAATPQEVAFFANQGFGVVAVVIFGVVQTVGALALALPKTRFAGALVTAICFLASSTMIFVSDNWQFGAMSLLPVVIALIIAGLARPITDGAP